MAVTTAKVEGLADLKASLDRLAAAAARRLMRKAVTQGVKVASKQAKADAPRDTGLLRKSIGQKVKVYRGSGTVAGIMGPRTGFATTRNGRPVDPVRYGHIAESGRGPVQVRRKRVLYSGVKFYGRRVAAYAGKAFIKPAIHNPAVFDAVRQSATEQLAAWR